MFGVKGIQWGISRTPKNFLESICVKHEYRWCISGHFVIIPLFCLDGHSFSPSWQVAILLRKRLLDSLAKNDENFIGIYTKLKVVLKLLKRKKFFNCSKNEAIFFVKLLNGSQLRVFSYRIFPSKNGPNL